VFVHAWFFLVGEFTTTIAMELPKLMAPVDVPLNAPMIAAAVTWILASIVTCIVTYSRLACLGHRALKMALTQVNLGKTPLAHLQQVRTTIEL